MRRIRGVIVIYLRPNFVLRVVRPSTPSKSNFPLTALYLTPIKSCVRPPLTMTTENLESLCPIPGMWQVMNLLFRSSTRTTFLLAELGFFGFSINTFLTVPILNGLFSKAGTFVGLIFFFLLNLLTNCLMVVINLKWVNIKQYSL